METLDDRIRVIEDKLCLCGDARKPVPAPGGARPFITLMNGKFVTGVAGAGPADAGGPLDERALRRCLQKVNELSETILSDMDRCRGTCAAGDRLQGLERALDRAAALRSRVAECFAARAHRASAADSPNSPNSPKSPKSPKSPNSPKSLNLANSLNLPNSPNSHECPRRVRPATAGGAWRNSASAELFRLYGAPAAAARDRSAAGRAAAHSRMRHACALRHAKKSDARGARSSSAAANAAVHDNSRSSAAATRCTAALDPAAPKSPARAREESPSSPLQDIGAQGITQHTCGERCTDTHVVGERHEIGNVSSHSLRDNEAVRVYSEAIERDPTNDSLLCNRAAAYLLIHQYTLALMDCECVIQRVPHNLKAHWCAAKALLYLNRVQEAKRHYRIACELCVDLVEEPFVVEEARAVQALETYYVHAKDGRWENSVCCAAELLRVFGSDSFSGLPWRCLKGEAMLHIDPTQTLEEIKLLRDDYPNYTELLFLHAKCLFYCFHDVKSTKEVKELLRKASLQKEKEGVLEDSRYVHLGQTVLLFERYRDMGNAAYNSGNWSEAYAAYTRCLTIDPLNKLLMAAIHCNRAAACMQDMRWNDALEDMHRSIRISGNNAKAYARRARIYLHFTFDAAMKGTDYLALAIADLTRAVELAPTNEHNRRLAEAVQLQKDREAHRAGESYGKSYARPASGSRSATPQTFAQFHADRQRKQRQRTADGFNGISASERVQCLLAIGIDDDREPEAQTVAKAYREAALRWHPDKWVNAPQNERKMAEKKFKEINRAYQSLKDSMTQ